MESLFLFYVSIDVLQFLVGKREGEERGKRVRDKEKEKEREF